VLLGGGDDTVMVAGLGGGGDPSVGSNMGVCDGQGGREWRLPRDSDHV
jgi:hypothetical protein